MLWWNDPVRRRSLRKSAIGLAILLFLVLAGLILAPALVDLNRLKPRIAAQLAAETGRSVELLGPLGLSLLPGLTITAHDIRLANLPGAAAKDMVRLRALEVKPAFWPLLKGAFEIRSARLIQPEIELERLADGSDNWHFTPAAGAGDVFVLALERCAVEDGTVTYRSPSAVERFEHIDATTALGGPAGPFDASGTLVTHGASLTVAVQSGALDAAEVPLRATVSAKPLAQLELDAVLSGGAGDRRLSGKLKLTAENFQAMAATLTRLSVPAVLAQSFALTGELTGSPRGLALDKLALDLGVAHGEGRLNLDFGTPLALALKLSVGRLDLDRWSASHKAALPPAPGVLRGGGAVAPVDPTAPLPLAPQPPPPSVKTGIAFGIDTLFWHGGLVRNVRLEASLADEALTIERLTALLPGGAALSLSGSGRLAPDGAQAQGLAEVNADDLRSLLGWLGVDASRVPADRLRRTTLSTRISLARDRLELDDIAASLDTTRLTGAATVLLRERPGIGLRLSADRFNLDAYLPGDAAPDAAVAIDTMSAALRDLDANVDGRVAALTWRGQSLGDVHLAVTLQNQALSIHDLSIGDLGGAHGAIGGTIDASSGTPKGQLDFELQGPELEHVLRMLSASLATGRLYGEFHASGALRAEGDALSLEAALDLLGGHARVAGKLAGGESDLALDLEHPSFAGLLHQLSPDYQPAGDPGELTLSAHLLGTPAHLTIDPLGFAIGPATAEGRVELHTDEARPHVAINLKLGDWRLDAFMPRRQAAMIDERGRRAGLRPGVILAEAQSSADASRDLGVLALADVDLDVTAQSVVYGNWRLDQAALSARSADGALALTRLSGAILGGSLEATGKVEPGAAPALELRLALKDADLKQALEQIAGVGAIAGRLDAETHLQSAGDNAAELIAHLSGDGVLKGRDGHIAGIDLVAIEDRLSVPERPPDLLALLRSGAGGQTAFSTLGGSFHIADGVMQSDDLRLEAEAGEGRAGGRIDLRQGTLASRVELRFPSIADAPPLAVTIDGPLAEPRVIFETNALQRFVEQRRAH
jgi:uncharacterized protein involved in outer membrane biogenesis